MAFQPGPTARIAIGALRASAYARDGGVQSTTNMINVTTLEQVGVAGRPQVFIPGQDTSTFNAAGPLDIDAVDTSMFDALKNWKQTSLPVTYGPHGFTAGTSVWLVNGVQTSLTTTTSVTGSVDWSCAAQTDGYTDFNGVTLVDWSAATADASSTAIDNGASTANGGVAHLHVSAFSGLTSDAIILEHSANNSVWATLGTFTTVTGVGSERLVIAAGTTVNRYLRISDDVTGTGSITRLVAFARR
jgi:hypothetical protein